MTIVFFSGPVTIVHTGQDSKTLPHKRALPEVHVHTPDPSSLPKPLARLRVMS